MPESWKTFMAFLEEKFPRLVDRYREWYGRSMNAPEDYRREIKERVANLRRKYSLGSLPSRPAEQSWHSPQMQFALDQGEQQCRK